MVRRALPHPPTAIHRFRSTFHVGLRLGGLMSDVPESANDVPPSLPLATFPNTTHLVTCVNVARAVQPEGVVTTGAASATKIIRSRSPELTAPGIETLWVVVSLAKVDSVKLCTCGVGNRMFV